MNTANPSSSGQPLNSVLEFPAFNHILMNNTQAPTAEEAAPAPVSKFRPANSDGIYENADQIFVPLQAGNICHFLIAETEAGFIAGFKFFTRQPKNQVHNLPRDNMPAIPSRNEALGLCVESALLFFKDHATVVARIAAWSRDKLPLIVTYALEDSLAVGHLMGRGPVKSEPVADPIVEAVPPVAVEPAPVSENVIPFPPVAAQPGATSEVSVAVESDVIPKPHYAELRLDEIARGDNPRRGRNPEKFAELVESLRTGPLLQPIAVRDRGEGREGKPDTKRYEIIFGEGRYLAFEALKRGTIEARVWSGVDAATVKAWALVENLQREDMNAIDEAEGFADLSKLGWSPARMSEKTGKTTRAIRYALSLNKLPEMIRDYVRAGELSARQARVLVRWVVAPGFEEGAENSTFKAMPRVAEIIASVAIKSKGNISSEDLAAHPVPNAAIGILKSEKLIAEISSVYVPRIGDRIERFVCALAYHYTFDVDGWKALKKTLDAEDRLAAERASEKAQAKVASRVSVPVVELQKAKEKYYEMSAAEEIYVDYLPDGACIRGIGESGAEVMLCLKPELLSKLKSAAETATADHNRLTLELAESQAVEKIRKLKKVGSRELTVVIVYGGLSYITEAAWRGQGIKVPSKWRDHNRNVPAEIDMLCGAEAVTVCRVAMHAALMRVRGDFQQLEILQVILETNKIGLSQEDPKFRARLLDKLSGELFPKIEEPVATPKRSAASKSISERIKKRTSK